MALFDTLNEGDELPERQFETDTIGQFMYNAVLWNAHKIHFDLPYATEEEGYPGLVVAGPLQGDWLTQVVVEWLGDAGRITGIEYSNRAASYVGETLTAGGSVSAIDREKRTAQLDVFVKNAQGEVTTPGSVAVEFAQEAS